MKISGFNRFAAVLLLTVFLFSESASAYLDPGTGSFVLQFFLAGVFAASFALKMFWKNIKEFFTGKRTSNNDKE